MNRKAQIGIAIQDTVAFIFVLFALFLFFVFSGAFLDWFKSHAKEISSLQELQSQAHHSLYAWLQKRVDENLTVADLVRLSVMDPSYKDKLEQEAKLAFDFYDYELKIEGLEGGAKFYIPSNKTLVLSLKIKRK